MAGEIDPALLASINNMDIGNGPGALEPSGWGGYGQLPQGTSLNWSPTEVGIDPASMSQGAGWSTNTGNNAAANAAAMKALGQAGADMTKAAGPGQPLPAPTFDRTKPGAPTRAVDLNVLVNQLLKRREELLASATSPGRAQPMPPPHPGLLGI